MKINHFLLTAALTLVATFVFASGTPGPPSTTPIPVDGGVLILAAAGAAYGYKKIQDNRKAKSDKEI